MLTSRIAPALFGILVAVSFTTACGNKKGTTETRGLFPRETDLASSADGSNSNSATDPMGQDGTGVNGRAGSSTSGGFGPLDGMDSTTRTIAEPPGRSFAETGEPIPELTPVYFAVDRYDLGESARALLTRAVGYLRNHPDLFVVLRGHTDDTGTEEYNLALGSQRAQAVRQFLVEQGLPAARLETLSFGKSMPAVEGIDDASRAQNRRVEFFVYTLPGQ